MKRKIYSWIMILPLLLCLVTACGDEELVKQSAVGDKEVWAQLSFGVAGQSPVKIDTRTTYDLRYESMVRNLYVFVFVGNERVYGHFFDENNFTADVDDDEDSWTVHNKTDNSTSTYTTGTVRMKVPVVTDGGAEIVMIANLDLDFINVSHERLSLVSNKSELENIVVSLNQEFPNRNAGYFIMTGSKDGVTIANVGTITVPENTIELYRLDAKVEVNVKIDPESTNSENQQVKAFEPESWRVINLPKSAYLLPHDTDPNEGEQEAFFHLEPTAFDVSGNTEDAFSFYMMENRAAMKQTTNGNYHLRDKRIKHADGTYNNESGWWEYAPEGGTYLEIKGQLDMLVDPEATKQHLTADVTYYIHLGDFASDKDNYDIERNTHYTYNITLKGVNNIQVEVITSNDATDGVTESQPGAMGNVYSAEEEIYTFDAHYGQRVYTFPASSINPDAMTWYVKTPFGREGTPERDPLTGQEIYNDLDYKWVEFCVNEMENDGIYSYNNRPYPGNGHASLMDVVKFMSYLKTEKLKHDAGQESAFDKEGNLRVTIFVNEFYYEVDPMNPNNKAKDLWKRFVNQPNRLMHVLCESAFSKDGDSSFTGSIVTIRQRSIQTPYNLKNADLMTAWGCETVDEKTSNYGFYNTNESVTNAPASFDFLNNDSPDNGLYNTLGLWGLNNNGTLRADARWETYLDYKRENDYNLIWMKDSYAVMRWSTMMRNRDNNGNGVIDPEEIRWYQAATNQLLGLYIGELGVSNDARLYNTEYAVNGYDATYGHRIFRRHVLSSTKCSENNSVLDFWAEQGIVTTNYRRDYYENYGTPFYPHLSIRCVRNLGMDNPTAQNIVNPSQNIPQPLVVMKCIENEGTANAVYSFDLRNVNEESLRYYTTKELLPTNEFSTSARTYRGFITGGLTFIRQTTGTTTGYADYINLKNSLDNNESPITQDSYRVPNIREAALMTLYIKNNNWWGNDATMISTYTGLGQTSVGGLGLENGNSWCFGGNNYIVQNENVHSGKRIIIRHVKDWNPE